MPLCLLPESGEIKVLPFLALSLEISFCYGVFSGRFLGTSSVFCGGNDLDGSVSAFCVGFRTGLGEILFAAFGLSFSLSLSISPPLLLLLRMAAKLLQCGIAKRYGETCH